MKNEFDLDGKIAVVTGGYGVLGGSMAQGLAAAGAKIAVLGRNRSAAEAKASQLRSFGGETMALEADVLDAAQLRVARDELVKRWGTIDILIMRMTGMERGAAFGNRIIGNTVDPP
jgi:Short-chain alcohol dehydrogenase of unknown specificity